MVGLRTKGGGVRKEAQVGNAESDRLERTKEKTMRSVQSHNC